MRQIYLFTDGGAFSENYKDYEMCSAFVMHVDEHKLCEKSYYEEEGTSPRAEIYGINKGLKEVLSLMETVPDDYSIHLFTDSELCYLSLTQWIFGWIKRAGGIDNEYKGGKTKKAVANQDLIREAYKSILEITNKAKFRMYHINSHVPVVRLAEAYEKFNKYNKVAVSPQFFKFCYENNRRCDALVKEKYEEITNKKENNK